jgi:uncharacterized RDD family membrane protein YckC
VQTYGQFDVFPLIERLPIWRDRDQTDEIRVAARNEKLRVVRSEGALYCVRLLGFGYGYVRAEDVISESDARRQAAAARGAGGGHRAAYPTGGFPGDAHTGFVHVGFLERLLAYGIDTVIMVGIFYAIAVVLDVQRPGFFTETVMVNGTEIERRGLSLWAGEMGTVNVGSVTSMVVSAVYWIASWSFFGATPGKMVLGQQVVHAQTGGRIGIGAATLRYVGTIIAAIPLCLGYLWIIWDAEKQGWHDKIANTRVVRL